MSTKVRNIKIPRLGYELRADWYAATIPFAKAFNADTWNAAGFKHGFGESDVNEGQVQAYYKKIADWINDES